MLFSVVRFRGDCGELFRKGIDGVFVAAVFFHSGTVLWGYKSQMVILVGAPLTQEREAAKELY